MKLWECTSNGPELRAALTGANASIMSVDFDNSANFMLASSSDYAIRVWTVDDHRLRVRFDIFAYNGYAFRLVKAILKCKNSTCSRTFTNPTPACIHVAVMIFTIKNCWWNNLTVFLTQGLTIAYLFR